MHKPIEIDYSLKFSLEKSQTQSAIAICPKCGAEMKLRKACKGERTGKEFWGCSKYPKCRGIINIS